MQALSQLSYTPNLILDSSRCRLSSQIALFAALFKRDQEYMTNFRLIASVRGLFSCRSARALRRATEFAHDRTPERAPARRVAASSVPTAARVSFSACWMVVLFHSPSAARLLGQCCHSAGRTASVTWVARSSAEGVTGAKYIASQSASAATVAQRSLNRPTLGWICSTVTAMPLRGQLLDDKAGQPRLVDLLHVMPIDPVQLGRVPLGRALGQVRAVEPLTICSAENSSSSPWLQPRRAR